MIVRPILFNGEMVRAVMSGRKTQTRRLVKPYQVPTLSCDPDPKYPNHKWISIVQNGRWGFAAFGATEEDCARDLLESCGCGYGYKGRKLWVRETHSIKPCNCCAAYKADEDPLDIGPWRPSIHMPRWASRITLEITRLRIERLHAITSEDAFSEGCPDNPPQDPLEWFKRVWTDTGGDWSANPWVWVIEFKRVES